MIRTPLCDLLGIEHPIMLAGMGGVSYSAVTAAVSEAGGFGCLGAAIMNHDEMKREIAAVRTATTKPFGVDLLTASPRDLVFRFADTGAGARAAVSIFWEEAAEKPPLEALLGGGRRKLAYEIAVPAGHGDALWRDLMEAGREFGIRELTVLTQAELVNADARGSPCVRR